MIKKQMLTKFLREHAQPLLDRFFLFEGELLVRVTSIFLHGICFQRSSFDDDVYAHGFVDFLPSGDNTIGFVLGERIQRADNPGHTAFDIEPPEESAELIVKSLRANPYYPHIVNPGCRTLLSAFDGYLDAVWAHFGLASCAIMDGEREIAARQLKQFNDIIIKLTSTWAREAQELFLELNGQLDNLDRCRDLLWERSKQAIRLRKLEKVAELSGWKPV